ncbi:MAG: RNA 2',3'-cyclic phosphodiesterase [Proteobacteria bacterium]|nr:RNA 2',3'-cyclic phosphodiesterase [Pseudomonadota bacterium]
MADTIRTFIAIELPENIIDSIQRVQEGMRSYGFNVRWVRPQNVHLTLKFLGDINAAETEKVGRAIFESTKGFAPLVLAAKGLGTFPSIKRSRVIWIGVAGQFNELIGLQKTLDEKLAAIGFTEEKRAFKGHLTLGRAKGSIDPKQLLEAMKEFAGFETEPFVANKVVLFKSELRPAGAVYSKLMEASLVD